MAVAEPRLLAWLRECTVLVKSEHDSTTSSEYTENIIYILHLQRSLVCQKCVTITYETLFARAGRAHGTAAFVPHTQTSSRNPLVHDLCKTCTNHDITVYYAQLHIDDAILCIINPRRACAARVTVVGFSVLSVSR